MHLIQDDFQPHFDLFPCLLIWPSMDKIKRNMLSVYICDPAAGR